MNVVLNKLSGLVVSLMVLEGLIGGTYYAWMDHSFPVWHDYANISLVALLPTAAIYVLLTQCRLLAK